MKHGRGRPPAQSQRRARVDEKAKAYAPTLAKEGYTVPLSTSPRSDTVPLKLAEIDELKDAYDDADEAPVAKEEARRRVDAFIELKKVVPRWKPNGSISLPRASEDIVGLIFSAAPEAIRAELYRQVDDGYVGVEWHHPCRARQAHEAG